MKFTTLLTLTVSVATVEASTSFIKCGWEDLKTDTFRALAQGFQGNKVATNSDCYSEVGHVLERLDTFERSVTPEYFYAADWLRPVYNAQDVVIEWTRMMSACQAPYFAKQLQMRVSSWPGVLDIASNAAGSVMKALI